MTSTITPATVALQAVAAATKPAKTAPKTKTVLTPGQVQALKRRSALKAKIKEMENRVQAYDAYIDEVLDAAGADIGTTKDGINVVERMYSTNTRYDRQVLTTRFPAAAAASFVSSRYTYLKTI